MKTSLRPPRFLPDVLQAICELKEAGGSTTSQIVSYVKSKRSSLNPRNLTTQVRRALNHAATNGIVKYRAGKYRVNKVIFDPMKDCADCKRRRSSRRRSKGRRRSGRRRGRGHAIFGSDSDSDRIDLVSDSDSNLTMRRKTGKRRPRRRARRRSILEVPRNSKNDISVARKSTSKERRSSAKREIDNAENMDGGMIYPDDHKDDHAGNMVDAVQCDNPECLCNTNDGNEERRNSDG